MSRLHAYLMTATRHLVAPLACTRSLLHVHGADAPKFLQGLVTNDLLKPAASSSSASNAIYAGFLSAQGRVLHDTFMLPQAGPSQSSGANEFLIDFPHAVATPSLPAYIKRYILRSKVKAKLADDQYRIWGVFSDPIQQARSADDVGEGTSNSSRLEEELSSLAGENTGKWWRDSRSKRMGYRLLLPPEASKAIESASE